MSSNSDAVPPSPTTRSALNLCSEGTRAPLPTEPLIALFSLSEPSGNDCLPPSRSLKDGVEVEGVKYDLEGYFHEVIIGGPGAFTVVTETPEDFPRAIVNKLVLEVSSVARPTRQTAAR